MKNDPYSRLGGLDQLLFQANTPKQRNNTTTKQRHNETTLSRDNEAAKVRSHEATVQRANAASTNRDNAPAKNPPNEPTSLRDSEATPPRVIEPTRTRVSVPTGHRPSVRKDERHSHDIFHDQVRWMNRVKLDIEETYGAKVTSNGIVQLALDLFIHDYETKGEDSALICTLVLMQPGTERGGR